jgi:hypothetical protein
MSLLLISSIAIIMSENHYHKCYQSHLILRAMTVDDGLIMMTVMHNGDDGRMIFMNFSDVDANDTDDDNDSDSGDDDIIIIS